MHSLHFVKVHDDGDFMFNAASHRQIGILIHFSLKTPHISSPSHAPPRPPPPTDPPPSKIEENSAGPDQTLQYEHFYIKMVIIKPRRPGIWNRPGQRVMVEEATNRKSISLLCHFWAFWWWEWKDQTNDQRSSKVNHELTGCLNHHGVI